MPIFEVQSPDGRMFEVDAPDQQTALSSLGMSPEPARPERSMLESAINGVASGVTLGFDDEIAAGLQTGAGLWGDYEATRDGFRREKGEMAEDNPAVNFTGELAGGLLTGTGLVKGGVTLAGKAVGRPFTQKAGLMALEGAGYGAATGVGHSEGGLSENIKDASLGALTGFGVGAAIPAVGAGVRAATAKAPKMNSLEFLKKAKDKAYRAVDSSGFVYQPRQLGGFGF